MTISRRDARGRQAPCSIPVHNIYGRNARGQCTYCQLLTKDAYERRNTAARYITKLAWYRGDRGDDTSLPSSMAAYYERHPELKPRNMNDA
jgi:hypothetical protein